jgi:hypothetical protein
MRIAAAVAVVALATSPVAAKDIEKTVPAGESLKSIGFSSINPDCSSGGYPNVRIVTKPSNGELNVAKGDMFPSYPKNNPRSACNAKKVAATMLDYQPKAGFTGKDSFAVQVIFPSGKEEKFNYAITVK